MPSPPRANGTPRTTAARYTSNGWPWMRCVPGCRRRICASAVARHPVRHLLRAMPPQVPPSQARGWCSSPSPARKCACRAIRPPHWPGRRPLEPDRCRPNPALAGPLPWLGKEPARHAAHRLGQRPGTATAAMEGRLEARCSSNCTRQPRACPPVLTPKPTPFQLQTSLTSPQLDLVLPQASGTADATNVATLVQLRALKAELNGQLTQATLRLEGEARTGTQRLSLQTQATGGLSGAGQWQAQWSQLRAQWQDARRPGVWTAQLTQPWAMSLRTGASPATAVAPPARPHLQQALRPPANPRGSPCKPAPGRRKSPGPCRAPWRCAGSPCG